MLAILSSPDASDKLFFPVEVDIFVARLGAMPTASRIAAGAGCLCCTLLATMCALLPTPVAGSRLLGAADPLANLEPEQNTSAYWGLQPGAAAAG